jgi:hypothetical protein
MSTAHVTRSSSIEGELWQCALHEAGHAVMASLYGLTVKQIVLHQPGSRATAGGEGGRCEIADQLDTIDTSPFQFLVYAFGGGAAERRASGRTSSRDGRDWEQAANVASIKFELDPQSPRITQLLDTAEQVAYARMLDGTIWAWTENVARVLLQKRQLTGFDVHQLNPRGRR